jgi:transcriptional regulator GlxA family with amidase domain
MNEGPIERSGGEPNRHRINQPGERAGGRGDELQIAVIVFPGFRSLDVALIDQIFHYANQLHKKRYSVRLLSLNGGLVTGTLNMGVWSDATAAMPIDIVFVSGGDGALAAAHDARLLDWMRETSRRSRLLIGVAEGCELISAAGISGCDVRALEWRVRTGVSSPPRGIYDPCGALFRTLSIVKRDLGMQVAQEVGERVVPDSGRWLSAMLGEPSDDVRRDRIRETADWIEQNCSRPITVTDISQFALMSERTLLRHFKAVMGMTPSDYLLKARFELACRLLVSTALPIDKIARRCSFSSGMALAKLFRKRLSVSASEYRAAAQGSRPRGGVHKKDV